MIAQLLAELVGDSVGIALVCATWGVSWAWHRLLGRRAGGAR